MGSLFEGRAVTTLKVRKYGWLVSGSMVAVGVGLAGSGKNGERGAHPHSDSLGKFPPMCPLQSTAAGARPVSLPPTAHTGPAAPATGLCPHPVASEVSPLYDLRHIVRMSSRIYPVVRGRP